MCRIRGSGWREGLGMGRGFCVNGTVANGTVAQPTGTGGGVAPMVTVSAAAGVRVWGSGQWCLGAGVVLGFEMVWGCVARDVAGK